MKDGRRASAKPEVGSPHHAVEETPVTDVQHQHPIAESLLAQVLEQDNLVRALPLQVHDEADAAAIVLMLRTVQAEGTRLLAHVHCPQIKNWWIAGSQAIHFRRAGRALS